MDSHGRCADVPDSGVTARAASCHLCLLRRPLPARAMMTRRGASLVPEVEADTPCQARLTSAPGPRLSKEKSSSGPSRGSPGHALSW
jgi:hypothetical protein